MTRTAVVISTARTPFGKFGGVLQPLTAVELGAHAIRSALGRVPIEGGQVDQVLMGMVLQAGAGQIPSRQASVAAGLPTRVPSATVNKVCASSLWAANLGETLIRAGEASVVVAGGMESMSNAPYLLPGARWGQRMGDAEMVDSAVHDGLWCSFGGCHMGVYGGDAAREMGISRAEQDAWALRSHRRAVAAQDEGRFTDELVPVEVPPRRGSRSYGPLRAEVDEAPRRDTSPEQLAALKPVFRPDDTVTAGNAPGLNDGAAALVLAGADRARELGVEPLATVVSHAGVSQEPGHLHTVPWLSAQKALQKAGLTPSDVALWEINEAFAAVALASIRLGHLDPERVNVDGGAIALGHPIGASGARILIHLIHALRRRGGGYGVAAICSGGGQGEATVVRVG
ncbi:acetyl-CoA C-acetyltransferase [Limnochorda pilosa]|uniref:acetyl-CoA C-acetyltransferase n=1 Tax=Limnochorda pilosa TaxID=1555112 RepID=A0A0K2SHT9_LIMPI|nr:acetyl-CoA C-acetyltransferase [Limnochorda pilosa]BAS26676.1 acetyl-CoA acetyltransferase [Limnochorda pilosa]